MNVNSNILITQPIMNVQHQSGDTKGEFFIEKESSVVAKMTYSKLGSSQIIIDHTEVSDDMRGQDLGKALVEAGVEYARERGLKVIPLCPFAKAIIEKNVSLQDVLK
jgi:predicted GNAT family acetyltransferase